MCRYGKLLRFFQIWVDIQILLTKDFYLINFIFGFSVWSNKCRLVPRCPKLAYIIKTIPLVNKLPQATMRWLNNGHYRPPSPKLSLPTTLTTMNVFEERESVSFSSSYFCTMSISNQRWKITYHPTDFPSAITSWGTLYRDEIGT